MEIGFPFTSAQWKELERQAVIYKYMAACIPVPVHLLPPFAKSSPSSTVDSEAGRCRRTDGKKWRCSRDVAPNQKYCERHINRGRPRSRKHVEPHQQTNNKKPRHHHHPSTCLSPSFYPHFQPRNLEWMMRTEQQQREEQQWLHLINPVPAPLEEQTYLNLATDKTTPLCLSFNPSPSNDVSLSEARTTVNDLSHSLSLGMGNWVNSVSGSSSSCSWVSPLAEVLRPATGLNTDSPPGVIGCNRVKK